MMRLVRHMTCGESTATYEMVEKCVATMDTGNTHHYVVITEFYNSVRFRVHTTDQLRVLAMFVDKALDHRGNPAACCKHVTQSVGTHVPLHESVYIVEIRPITKSAAPRQLTQ